MGRVLSRKALLKAIARERRAGRRIVFTNGCFDLLHPGHVKTLAHARSLGDRLVLGLNSDASVRRLKGPGRPVLKERDRARVLAALSAVDYVTVFSESTPERLIKAIRPDVLVKGADWASNKIVGRRYAGRVARIPLVKGISTSAIINRIRKA